MFILRNKLFEGVHHLLKTHQFDRASFEPSFFAYQLLRLIEEGDHPCD